MTLELRHEEACSFWDHPLGCCTDTKGSQSSLKDNERVSGGEPSSLAPSQARSLGPSGSAHLTQLAEWSQGKWAEEPPSPQNYFNPPHSGVVCCNSQYRLLVVNTDVLVIKQFHQEKRCVLLINGPQWMCGAFSARPWGQTTARPAGGNKEAECMRAHGRSRCFWNRPIGQPLTTRMEI